MAARRIPKAKAEITGATSRNPARFRGRNEPEGGPLGEAPTWMTAAQRAMWNTFANELPWLNGSHRALVEIAVTVRARLVAGEEVGVQALNLLRLTLSQMGASPVDASKVYVPVEDEPDPAEKYFN